MRLLCPSSPLYEKKWGSRQKKFLIAVILLINISVFGIMARLNLPYINVTMDHHLQYHKLAVALTEGKASIELGIEKALSTLTNPYDAELRFSSLNTDIGWDTAFYEGKFYVYFGIVPVLLFYLPYYLLFHSAFPTWLGIFFTGAVLLVGCFYLLHQLVRRHFPKTPFLLYLLLSILLGNGIGTIPIMLRPDFYSLPILCAMCFTLWGLALWVRALTLWEQLTESQKKHQVIISFFAGSVCMALTAGCRPQFLMGSFLLLPLIYGSVKKKVLNKNSLKLFCGENISCIISLVLPYVIVAAGLMYYNYIRFDSVFDFGASYNLTTNDMTRRGVNLERLPDGIYCYLFQFPNIGLRFPFVENASMNSDYLGIVIQELMFGGILFTHVILFVLFLLRTVKSGLRSKNLYGLSICCLVFGLIIVIADTEMAGILSRYYADFLWIFTLPALLIILQLWESATTAINRKRIVLFVLLSGFYGLLMDCFIGIRAGGLESNNIHWYYMIKSIFM